MQTGSSKRVDPRGCTEQGASVANKERRGDAEAWSQGDWKDRVNSERAPAKCETPPLVAAFS